MDTHRHAHHRDPDRPGLAATHDDDPWRWYFEPDGITDLDDDTAYHAAVDRAADAIRGAHQRALNTRRAADQHAARHGVTYWAERARLAAALDTIRDAAERVHAHQSDPGALASALADFTRECGRHGADPCLVALLLRGPF